MKLKKYNVNLCLFYFIIFFNIIEFVTIVNLFPFQIYLQSKTKLTTASVRTHDAEIEYWNNSFWKCAVLKIWNKNNINGLKHIVHLYCTCFILGPLRQDFIKIFRYCCFFPSVFTHPSYGGNPVQTDVGIA